jgi:hypothetical protein
MPDTTSTTRDELLTSVVERRRFRVLQDANHSTSIEEEVDRLLRDQRPFSGMNTQELLAEWDHMENTSDEDPSEYRDICPTLDLAALRSARAGS